MRDLLPQGRFLYTAGDFAAAEIVLRAGGEDVA